MEINNQDAKALDNIPRHKNSRIKYKLRKSSQTPRYW